MVSLHAREWHSARSNVNNNVAALSYHGFGSAPSNITSPLIARSRDSAIGLYIVTAASLLKHTTLHRLRRLANGPAKHTH